VCLLICIYIGKYTLTGTTGSSDASACLSCPSGWAGAAKAAGLNVVDKMEDACSKCPDGTYVSSILNTCEKCAAGTYSNLFNDPDKVFNKVCFHCQPGLSQPLVGQSSCVSCAPGKYSSKGQRTCATVPVNHEPIVSLNGNLYQYCSYTISFGVCKVVGGICTGKLVGDSNADTTQCTASAAGSVAKPCIDIAFGGSCTSATCGPSIAVVPALATGGATAYRPCPAGQMSDGKSKCV